MTSPAIPSPAIAPAAGSVAYGMTPALDALVHAAHRENPESLHRARLVASTCLVLLLLTVPMMLVRVFVFGDHAIAAAVGVGAVLLSTNLILLRRGVRPELLAVATIGELFVVVFGLAWAHGGIGTPAALWLTVIPLAAAHVVGPRAALVTAGCSAASLGGLFVAARHGFRAPLTSNDPLASLAWASLIMTCFLGLFGFVVERERRRFHRALAEANQQIRREMAERQKAEAALRISHRLEVVGQLAGGLAHEVNTPLQYVRDSLTFSREASADLLALAAEARSVSNELGTHPLGGRLRGAVETADLDYLDEHLPSAITRALEGVSRVAAIVDTLKAFAGADNGELVLGDLNDSLRTVVTMVETEFQGRLRVKADPAVLPLVPFRAAEVQQALLAIVVNAAQACETRHGAGLGTVTLTTKVEERHAVVVVSDDGCGIPREIHDKVFDPFFTTRDVGDGSGQGLALARTVIVDRHGGDLAFDSEVGRGTTFFIRLPLVGPMGVRASVTT
jgi:signal transduction histidine kinase